MSFFPAKIISRYRSAYKMMLSNNIGESEKGELIVDKLKNDYPGIHKVAITKAYKAKGGRPDRSSKPHSKPADPVPNEFKYVQTDNLNVKVEDPKPAEPPEDLDGFGEDFVMYKPSYARILVEYSWFLMWLFFQAISLAAIFYMLLA